jgi:hypothetical protein
MINFLILRRPRKRPSRRTHSADPANYGFLAQPQKRSAFRLYPSRFEAISRGHPVRCAVRDRSAVESNSGNAQTPWGKGRKALRFSALRLLNRGSGCGHAAASRSIRGPGFEESPVGMVETSAALGACLLLLTGAIVLDRRPYRPGKPNYVPVMIIALAASLVLGRHLISLILSM